MNRNNSKQHRSCQTIHVDIDLLKSFAVRIVPYAVCFCFVLTLHLWRVRILLPEKLILLSSYSITKSVFYQIYFIFLPEYYDDITIRYPPSLNLLSHIYSSLFVGYLSLAFISNKAVVYLPCFSLQIMKIGN